MGGLTPKGKKKRRATSGGSGIGKSGDKLAPYAPGAEIADAKLLRSADEAKSWVKSYFAKRP